MGILRPATEHNSHPLRAVRKKGLRSVALRHSFATNRRKTWTEARPTGPGRAAALFARKGRPFLLSFALLQRLDDAILYGVSAGSESGLRFDAGANLLPALRPFLRVQHFFSQPNRPGRDFDVFIVGDELDRLFESHLARRNQPDGFIRRRRTHVR